MRAPIRHIATFNGPVFEASVFFRAGQGYEVVVFQGTKRVEIIDSFWADSEALSAALTVAENQAKRTH
jgi:hypothetical protein